MNAAALVGLSLQLLTQLQTYQLTIAKAQAEGRDVTDEELAAAKTEAMDITRSPKNKRMRCSLGRKRSGVVRMFSAIRSKTRGEHAPQQPASPREMHNRDRQRHPKAQELFPQAQSGVNACEETDEEIYKKFKE